MDPALAQFFRQYLQQVSEPCYPSARTLLNPYVQEQIFHYMFDESQSLHLPSPRYQRRILKAITDRIESAIQDPDEDEILDDLMQHMAHLCTVEQLPPVEAAQQKTVISYFSPLESDQNSTLPILIEESPHLLAAGSNVGFRTWDACLRLAYYFSTAGQGLVRNKTILELGAGTGLLSILCAGSLGASHVLTTDGNPEVVASVDKNIVLNKALLQSQGTGKIAAKHLDWTDLSALSDTLSFPDNPAPKYDLLLGADITYNSDYFMPLVSTLEEMEERFPGIEIIISGAIRNINTFNAFVAACSEKRFDVADVDFECPPFHQQKGFFHTIALPIRILRIKRQRKETDLA